jgi:cytochrome c biogenesis protein CcmG/thiol:disulfide interchange protein DsbE
MDLKKENNLELIGLNYKDNFSNAEKFLNELKNPFTNIFLDKNGLIAIEWGAYGVPESFLIYNKKIIKKVVGPLNDRSIIEIKKLIR